MNQETDEQKRKARVAKQESEGAWIIHHGKKLSMDSHGGAEFPSIDQTAKATSLAVALSASDDDFLSIEKVRAIAQAAKLNPKRETDSFLSILEDNKLIERKDGGVYIYGLTNRAALLHASNLFHSENPEKSEIASIEISEITSESPRPLNEIGEYISDTYKFSKSETNDFIRRSEEIGFVDSEGEDSIRLIFNGNLFKKGSIGKTKKVLDSLSSVEQTKITELGDLLNRKGCIPLTEAESILGVDLLSKLKAAGMYEIHSVHNDSGVHNFLTAPASFHKFVNPMVDDAFDLAKALVAALTYGMTARHSSSGRIQAVDALLKKLISGATVGPATAIGHDYRVLEEKRVLEIIPEGRLFKMRLKKREVGEIALQVLEKGSAAEAVVDTPPAAAMSAYTAPEDVRWEYRRKKQAQPSKRATFGIIESLRSNKRL